MNSPSTEEERALAELIKDYKAAAAIGVPSYTGGISRKIAVELAADPQRGADWRLRPLDNQMKLRLGETGIAFFEAENRSDKPITVQAQYQVSPPAADKYIVRIACFCQDRQTLGPYQKADLPMTFFIDPAMAKDPAFASLKTITMSYKFQEAKTPDQQVAAIAAAEPMN